MYVRSRLGFLPHTNEDKKGREKKKENRSQIKKNSANYFAMDGIVLGIG